MSIRLLSLSSMYPGYIGSFYNKHKDTASLSYTDHYRLIMSETTEFAGSYTRNFRKLGIEAQCIISNDRTLQSKWSDENKLKSGRNSDILFKQVIAFKPDILWIENLNFINTEWIEKVRVCTRMIIAYHCAPYNETLVQKLKKVDFVITCTPGLKKSLEEHGLKTYLVYHGFDEDLLARIEKNNDGFLHDLVFSGSLITGGSFHNYRLNLIENLIREKIDMGLYLTLEAEYKIRAKKAIYALSVLLKKLKMNGLTERFHMFDHARSRVRGYSSALLRLNHLPLYGIDMYNLFNRSKIVLNMHIGVAGNFAGNMRMFEVTGVGSCLLTDNKHNMKDLFDTDSEVVVYNDPEDCLDKFRWLIEHEKERETIARKGQIHALKMHTVENRCNLILDIINGKSVGMG